MPVPLSSLARRCHRRLAWMAAQSEEGECRGPRCWSHGAQTSSDTRGRGALSMHDLYRVRVAGLVTTSEYLLPRLGEPPSASRSCLAVNRVTQTESGGGGEK